MTMVNIATTQFQNCSSMSANLETKDIDNKHAPALKVDYRPISFRRVSMLLSIVLDLEEQLWAMTRSPLVSKQVQDLWP